MPYLSNIEKNLKNKKSQVFLSLQFQLSGQHRQWPYQHRVNTDICCEKLRWPLCMYIEFAMIYVPPPPPLHFQWQRIIFIRRPRQHVSSDSYPKIKVKQTYCKRYKVAHENKNRHGTVKLLLRPILWTLRLDLQCGTCSTVLWPTGLCNSCLASLPYRLGDIEHLSNPIRV